MTPRDSVETKKLLQKINWQKPAEQVHNIKVERAGGTQRQFPLKYIENTI